MRSKGCLGNKEGVLAGAGLVARDDAMIRKNQCLSPDPPTGPAFHCVRGQRLLEPALEETPHDRRTHSRAGLGLGPNADDTGYRAALCTTRHPRLRVLSRAWLPTDSTPAG